MPGSTQVTGSDLCFSIRSVLLVEEPAGDKLEERGVRGERRGSGFPPGGAGSGRFDGPSRISIFLIFPKENHTFLKVRGCRPRPRFLENLTKPV